MVVDAKRPRVLIVGAGMAGLSAASRLHTSFHLSLLEASDRIGGRISTSLFANDRIELGATWIHGIQGSPVHRIAQRIGALKGDTPWERQDGFPGPPVVIAEGGFVVNSSVMQCMTDLYSRMMSEIRATGEPERADSVQKGQSIGSFLRQGFSEFRSQVANKPQIDGLISGRVGEEQVEAFHVEQSNLPKSSGWNLTSLQDAAFSTNEYIERVFTSANSLYELDLEAEKEYSEYPGEQITVGKGYVSVLNELESCLPAGTIQFGKKVTKIVWKCSRNSSAPVLIHCDDGSMFEADHVIITVSLGVLKAGTMTVGNAKNGVASACVEGKPVPRSINDFESVNVNHSLFEPPLPSCKLQAISRLGYGVVDKLFLQLHPRAEPQLRAHIQLMYKGDTNIGEEASPWWMRKTFSMAPIYKESDVLLCWLAGDEALEMEGKSDEEVMHGVAKTLARFGLAHRTLLRDRSLQPSSRSSSTSEYTCEDDERQLREETSKLLAMFEGVMRSSWGRNPLFRGSYSYVATGSSGEDFETLAEPLPKTCFEAAGDPGAASPLQLMFAGEATDRHFYSTTHGAYHSGVREANRLLQHYGLSHTAEQV